jgi:hypothetical protein
MTEQLTFRQRGRQGGAVDGNKRLIPTRADTVKETGPNFFARTGFTGEKNSAANLGRPFSVMRHALHSGVASNYQASRIVWWKSFQRSQRMQSHRCHLYVCSAAVRVRIAVVHIYRSQSLASGESGEL